MTNCLFNYLLSPFVYLGYVNGVSLKGFVWIFCCYATHGRHDELGVHHSEHHRPSADERLAHDDGIEITGLGLLAFQAVVVGHSVLEFQGVGRPKLSVGFFERFRIR